MVEPHDEQVSMSTPELYQPCRAHSCGENLVGLPNQWDVFLKENNRLWKSLAFQGRTAEISPPVVGSELSSAEYFSTFSAIDIGREKGEDDSSIALVNF